MAVHTPSWGTIYIDTVEGQGIGMESECDEKAKRGLRALPWDVGTTWPTSSYQSVSLQPKSNFMATRKLLLLPRRSYCKIISTTISDTSLASHWHGCGCCSMRTRFSFVSACGHIRVRRLVHIYDHPRRNSNARARYAIRIASTHSTSPTIPIHQGVGIYQASAVQ